MDPNYAVSDRAQCQVFGWSLLAAPLLTGAATFYWRGLALGITGGTLAVVAAVFWISALLGLVELLRPYQRRTAAVMTLVVIAAGIAFNNFGMEGIFHEGFKLAGGGEVSQRGLRLALGPALLVVMLVPGALFPLSLVALPVMLWRRRMIPVWCMNALVLGGLSFPVGRIPRNETVAHVTDLLLLVGLVPVAWRYLRRPLTASAR